MACVFAPVGIVLGILARKGIRRTGESGRGLATAGLWLGVVFTLLMTIPILFVVWLVLDSNSSTIP